jgi:hypothetical protein
MILLDRLERILTMMYVVQNSQNFSGLFPSSGIPVIEISSFQGVQLSKCLLPHLHLRTETDPVSETSCFLEYRTLENIQKNSVSTVYDYILNHNFSKRNMYMVQIVALVLCVSCGGILFCTLKRGSMARTPE